MNPVVHFEMPAEDRERMADFYARVFGWRAQMLGPEMQNYVIVKLRNCKDKRSRWDRPAEETRRHQRRILPEIE